MRREDYSATLVLAVGFVAATLTGFLREAALAFQFGTGQAADIYLIAFTIPEFVFIALPIVLSPSFIPFFAQLRLQVSEAAAWRFAQRLAGRLLVLLLGAAALIALGAPLYLPWLAPGFGRSEIQQATRAIYVMSPAICLMGVATLAGAVLQVYRRFARPALQTAIYNTTFVIVLLGLPLAWLVGRAAWGVTAGAAAALLLQLTLVLRYRRSALPPNQQDHPEQNQIGVRDVLQLAGPLTMGYAVHHIALFVDRAMATTLGIGGVATLNYGYRLALFVGQVSGLAVSTAMFPRMAEQAASEDLSGLKTSLTGALRFVWLIGLPAGAAMVLLREPLVQVLFERGAFDPGATTAVSQVLVWYTWAVLADALCQPLWRVLYARRSAWLVLAVNGLQTTIRIVCNVAFIGELGYNGLALSAAIGLSVQVLVLGLLVRRDLGGFLTGTWWRGALRVFLATVLAAFVVSLVSSQLVAGPALLRLLIAGSLGGAVYLTSLWLMERLSR